MNEGKTIAETSDLALAAYALVNGLSEPHVVRHGGNSVVFRFELTGDEEIELWNGLPDEFRKSGYARFDGEMRFLKKKKYHHHVSR